MRLDEATERLHELANELSREGILIPDYISAKFGVDRDEFLAFLDKRVNQILFIALAKGQLEDTLHVCLLDGIHIGWLMAGGMDDSADD